MPAPRSGGRQQSCILQCGGRQKPTLQCSSVQPACHVRCPQHACTQVGMLPPLALQWVATPHGAHSSRLVVTGRCCGRLAGLFCFIVS